jgi:hypothetical protein
MSIRDARGLRAKSTEILPGCLKVSMGQHPAGITHPRSARVKGINTDPWARRIDPPDLAVCKVRIKLPEVRFSMR